MSHIKPIPKDETLEKILAAMDKKYPNVERWKYESYCKDFAEMLLDVEALARQEGEEITAQECYLQCLAVECGEGECARAIADKFSFISKFENPHHE